MRLGVFAADDLPLQGPVFLMVRLNDPVTVAADGGQVQRHVDWNAAHALFHESVMRVAVLRPPHTSEAKPRSLVSSEAGGVGPFHWITSASRESGTSHNPMQPLHGMGCFSRRTFCNTKQNGPSV
jgi:hypothetical protein